MTVGQGKKVGTHNDLDNITLAILGFDLRFFNTKIKNKAKPS